MKKLITLALVSTMLLAIAAPALAQVGFGPEKPTPSPTPAAKMDAKVSVELYNYNPTTASFSGWKLKGGRYYGVYDTTIGIRAKDDLRFAIVVTLPAQEDTTLDLTQHYHLRITVNNVKDAPQVDRAESNKRTDGTDVVFEKTDVLGVYSAYIFQSATLISRGEPMTLKYMFTAQALQTADVTVTASLSGGRSELPLRFQTGGKRYDINGEDKKGFTVVVNDQYGMIFNVDQNDQITRIEAFDLRTSSMLYEVLRDIDNEIIFKSGETRYSKNNDPIYQNLYEAYTTVMDLFGFTWGQKGYMYAAAIVAKFNTGFVNTASKTYAAYKGALTVTDPNVVPPKTGHNSSAAGFVMIVLTIIATAAVTMKKIRRA